MTFKAGGLTMPRMVLRAGTFPTPVTVTGLVFHSRQIMTVTAKLTSASRRTTTDGSLILLPMALAPLTRLLFFNRKVINVEGAIRRTLYRIYKMEQD